MSSDSDVERRRIVRALLEWLLARHANAGPNEWASEQAQHHRRVAPTVREPTPEDLLPLFGGGFALAGVAIIVCAMINVIGIAVYAYFVGDDPGSWPTNVVAVYGVFAVLVSLLIGWWLVRLRRWIATRGDTQNIEMIRAKRRSFTIGAMILYVPMTPVVWLLIVSLAFSST